MEIDEVETEGDAEKHVCLPPSPHCSPSPLASSPPLILTAGDSNPQNTSHFTEDVVEDGARNREQENEEERDQEVYESEQKGELEEGEEQDASTEQGEEYNEGEKQTSGERGAKVEEVETRRPPPPTIKASRSFDEICMKKGGSDLSRYSKKRHSKGRGSSSGQYKMLSSLGKVSSIRLNMKEWLFSFFDILIYFIHLFFYFFSISFSFFQ